VRFFAKDDNVVLACANVELQEFFSRRMLASLPIPEGDKTYEDIHETDADHSQADNNDRLLALGHHGHAGLCGAGGQLEMNQTDNGRWLLLLERSFALFFLKKKRSGGGK
jgi:hypothetical protein